MNLEFLAKVAQRAGKHALEHQAHAKNIGKIYTGATSSYAETKQAFSIIDGQTQGIILEDIGQTYPHQYAVVCEENDINLQKVIDTYFLPYDHLKSPTIIIDPIDGTKNYCEGSNVWGVSISVVENKRTVLSAIAYPGKKILLTADSSATTINGKTILMPDYKYHKKQAVKFTGADEELASLQHYFPAQATNSFTNTILSLLGHQPQYFAYVGKNTELVDAAASFCIIPSAGGVILDKDGNEFNPLENITHSQPIKVQEFFLLAPSKEFGLLLLKEISKYRHI